MTSCKFTSIQLCVKSFNDFSLSVYLSIDREQPPQPAENWGVLDCDHYKPACPQYVGNIEGDNGIRKVDEDCLYLNVFSPWVQTSLLRKYPVMIYIHGGGFESGSGSIFPAHMLAASQEVVVVTFNYRLGLLGNVIFQRVFITKMIFIVCFDRFPSHCHKCICRKLRSAGSSCSHSMGARQYSCI